MTEQLAPHVPLVGPTDEDASLVLVLRRLEHALQTGLQPVLAAHHLQPEHWQVLSVLLGQPGLGMSELAAEAVLPAASLTRHMDRLVERALVVRRIAPDDKRRVVAALSPIGYRVAATIREAEHQIEEDLLSRLGSVRLHELIDALRR